MPGTTRTQIEVPALEPGTDLAALLHALGVGIDDAALLASARSSDDEADRTLSDGTVLARGLVEAVEDAEAARAEAVLVPPVTSAHVAQSFVVLADVLRLLTATSDGPVEDRTLASIDESFSHGILEIYGLVEALRLQAAQSAEAAAESAAEAAVGPVESVNGVQPSADGDVGLAAEDLPFLARLDGDGDVLDEAGAKVLSGAWETVGTVVVEADGASVEVDVPAGYERVEVRASLELTAQAVDVLAQWSLDGGAVLTAPNYAYDRLDTAQTNVTAARLCNAFYSPVLLSVEVPPPATGTRRTPVAWRADARGMAPRLGSAVYNAVGAVTRLRLSVSAGAIVAGSRVAVVGLRRPPEE